MVRKAWVCVLFLLAAAHLAPVFAAPAADAREQRPLVFGVYAHIRSTELVKKVAPLQQYLQEYLERHGIPVKIDLRLFPTYDEAIDALIDGQVDFVRFGPVSYVLAKKRNPGVRLLAMESNAGRRTFSGVISVARDSPVRSIDDLRGKRIAFGDRHSTTGRYLAQAALVSAGIRAADLAGYSYLGRHDKVAFAVAAGNYDAGASNENTFHKYASTKGLRKIAEFPCVTKPWAARAGMDESTFAVLRQALLRLSDPAVLQTIQRSGFLPAQDADYDLIRQAMRLAEQFDEESLRFAVYASVKPSDIYQLVQPVLDRMERKLRAEASIHSIRIKVFRSYQEAVDALIRGDVDFARFGPASYLVAKQANPHIQLLATEGNGSEDAAAVFVVAADSAIDSLSELAGKTFAFGSRLSTEGRFAAQAALIEAGIFAVDLKDYVYLGRHDRVAYAVAAGNYDAGALRKSVLAGNGIAGELRVIREIAVPEKVWVAREGMDADLFGLVQKALLDIRDDASLGPLGRRGFSPADNRLYPRIKQTIELAEQFEQRP